MARSWADVARGSMAKATPAAPAAAAPKVWTYADWLDGVNYWDVHPAQPKPVAPPCYYCGSAATVCAQCERMCACSSEWSLLPVLQRGRCAFHSGWSTNEFYNKKMEEFIPQTCAGCREKHPWREEDHIEITGYSYEKACMCHPLKYPNGGPFNVVYVPKCRFIRIGQVKSTREQVEAWAQATYDEEMAFSADPKRAQVLKQCVLENDFRGWKTHGLR